MIEALYDIQSWINLRKKHLKDKSIGFVPTMGALHHGHISLVKKSLQENEITLVSIYLNPTQFDSAEDLKKYPTSTEQDLDLLNTLSIEKKKTIYVLLPQYEEIYADNFKFKLSESDLSQTLCGAHRPGHFDGVLTIVLKLLNISGAQKSYFGEKDFQQYRLIDKMAKAFFLDMGIIPCPIVREEDGLAMSSRNKRLSLEERKQASELYKIISQSKSDQEAQNKLKELGFKVDYVIDLEKRRYAAAFLGPVRLIDNVAL